jgi:hypothetical protein
MRMMLLMVCVACGGGASRAEEPPPSPPPPKKDHLGEHLRAIGQRLAACRDPADPTQVVLGRECRQAVRTLVAGCGTADLQALETTDRVTDACKESLRALLPEADSFRSRLLVLGTARASGAIDVYVTASDALGEPVPLTATVSLEIAGNAQLVEGAVTPLPPRCDAPLFTASSILDYSGSMSDRDIDESIEIYKTLYDALGDGCLESDVVLFSTNVRPASAVTANRAALKRAIARDTTMPRESTALVDAMGDGVHALADRAPPVRLAIVATDGKENASRRRQLAGVLQEAKASQVRIISFGSLLSDTGFLEHAGAQTGGFFVYRPHPKLLASAAQIIGRLFAQTRRIRIADVKGATHVIVEHGGQRVRVPLTR